VFRKYRVQIRFRDRILGGIPKAKELLIPWLKGRGVPLRAAEELAEEIEPEVKAVSKEELEMAAWTTFKRDERGVYIEERQVNRGRQTYPDQTGPSPADETNLAKPIRSEGQTYPGQANPSRQAPPCQAQPGQSGPIGAPERGCVRLRPHQEGEV